MNDCALGNDLPVESLVGQVADEFTERLNRGEQPAVEEYAQRYPQIADLLRQALPALQAMVPAASDAALSTELLDPPQHLTGYLGDFRILREIGRGGMGVVHEAEQISLGRRVALKVLPFAAAMDAKQLQRFKNEAQAAAHLHHTNIVPVYAVGCARGVHFYAMQYIEGQTVAALIRELRQLAGLEAPDPSGSAAPASALASELVSGRWAPAKPGPAGDIPTGPSASSPRPAAAAAAEAATQPAGALSTQRSTTAPAFFRTVAHLGAQAAEALEHAHAKGIIHRDIKPANLLIDVGGNLWIADFGLARMLSEAGLTMTGDLLGTLRYMSPEQALAKRVPVDHRTDVYSLGVTLYELLTLRPAYDGRDRQEVLQQIAFEEPRLPRRFNKSIPPELETIVRKAIGKNPAERYATAQELADDLRRYLDNKPIRAKRPTLVDWTRKWARRHPGVVATGIGGLILAVGILAISTLMILSAYQTEAEQRQRAETHLYHSLVRQARAVRQARRVGYRGEVWKLLGQAMQLQTADKNLMELRNEAVACLGDFVGLEPTSWSEFSVDISSMALQPDGVQLVLGLKDGTILVRDRTSGGDIAQLPGHRAAVSSLSFGADGKCLASGDVDGKIQVWQAGAGGTWACQRMIQIDRPKRANYSQLGPRVAVALTPDGQYLATCSSDQASVWSLAAEDPPVEFQGRGEENLTCLAFSPDGSLLVAGYHHTGAHGILVWELATRRLKSVIPSPFAAVQVAFSPDGQLLGAACLEKMALFDTTAFQLRQFRISDCTFGLAFSPDSQLVATTGVHGGGITLWDVRRNHPVAHLQHPNHANLVAFSTDGKALVTADRRSVRIWNLAGAEEKLALSGHDGGASGVAFSPDGTLLASAGRDRMVKVWDTATGKLIQSLKGFREPPQTVAFSPKRPLLAAGDLAGVIHIWETKSWRPQPMPAPELGHEIYAVAFSPNDKYFAACGSSGAGPGGVILWHLEVHGPVPGRAVRLSSRSAESLCFSPDSSLLAWLETSATMQLWDLGSSRGRPGPPARRRGWYALAFPDRRHLVAVDKRLGSTDPIGLPEVWDVDTGQLAFSFAGGEFDGRRGVEILALSADGHWLAQSTLAPQVWDLERKKLLLLLPEERTYPWSLAWSPNQEHLAVGMPSGEVVIWNLPKIKAQLDEIGLGW
jgi:WD40 repeat protein/serine/threonine protein kinase